MSNDKSYHHKGNKAISQHRQQQTKKLEVSKDPNQRKQWTNYDEYINDQRTVFNEMKQRPAQFCGLCGYEMNYNGHKLTEWEKIWSVHEVCKAKMSGYLDREAGVARERRSRR